MADFWRKTLIQAKLCTLWFLRSLNKNLKLKVQNSKWRTKNGRLLEKNSDSSETLYTLVFEVAEYEFGIEIPEFKMADPK